MPGRVCPAPPARATRRSRCIWNKPQVYRCILINYTLDHPKYVFWGCQIASGTVFVFSATRPRCEWLPSRTLEPCPYEPEIVASAVPPMQVEHGRSRSAVLDRFCSKEIKTKHLFQRAHSSHPSTALRSFHSASAPQGCKTLTKKDARNIDKQQHTSPK